MIIDLAKQFSRYPSGRYPSDGTHNGQAFRTEYLVPALRRAISENTTVIVDIDGVRTFGSSFLEEAFAGLVRLSLFDHEQLEHHLEIRCEKPHVRLFKDAILSLIREAKPESTRLHA